MTMRKLPKEVYCETEDSDEEFYFDSLNTDSDTESDNVCSDSGSNSEVKENYENENSNINKFTAWRDVTHRDQPQSKTNFSTGSKIVLYVRTERSRAEDSKLIIFAIHVIENRDCVLETALKDYALIGLSEQSSGKNCLISENERFRSNQSCGKEEAHIAVLYCTVCAIHLCEACDTSAHWSKMLCQHKCVPCQRSRRRSQYPIHMMHIAEFVCTQDSYYNSLTCYLYEDYGRRNVHKVRRAIPTCVRSYDVQLYIVVALAEVEAEHIRGSTISSLQRMTVLVEDMRTMTEANETVMQEMKGWS